MKETILKEIEKCSTFRELQKIKNDLLDALKNLNQRAYKILSEIENGELF